MKNKKIISITFGIIALIIVVVCLIIQMVIKKEDKELQKENEKYKNMTIKTTSGVELDTKYTHIDDNTFYVKVPNEFRDLTYEEIHTKYQGDVPDVVFSNEKTTVNLAISLTENNMKDEEIDTFRKQMEETLKTSSEILSSRKYKVDNHTVGQIKLISKGIDTDIYNNMIFFSYNNKLVIIAFNSTIEEKEEWESVGDFLIDSLYFK